MSKLGKGLSELGLSELLKHSGGSSQVQERLSYLPINAIYPGKFQPRQHIDSHALEELANSIRVQGILQPIIVRPRGNQYEIIAGERRWRASKLAMLDKIPAIVREISDQTALAAGLIENIQRHDLNALEEAQAFQRLLQEFHLTHQEVADAVGKPRSSVTNLIRLTQLDEGVKQLLAQGHLDKGHALLLLPFDGQAQNALAQIIIAKKLSVRETEKLIVDYKKNAVREIDTTQTQDASSAQWQSILADKFHAKVTVQHNAKGKGKITIYYHNLSELEGIFTQIQ